MCVDVSIAYVLEIISEEKVILRFITTCHREEWDAIICRYLLSYSLICWERERERKSHWN